MRQLFTSTLFVQWRQVFPTGVVENKLRLTISTMKAKSICTKLISVLVVASSISKIEGLTVSKASVIAKLKQVDYLSLGTYASATICAGLEISEDISKIGHGHGVILLTLSNIFKEVAEVRRFSSWEGEELMEGIKPKGFAAELFEKNVDFLSCTYLTSSLDILALLAAFKEVSESMEIGGQHGMVFLALHDILELTEESTSATEVKVLENFTGISVLKLTLIAGALAAAGIETIQSLDTVGAHNGVFLLASLKTFKALGIFRRERKELKKKVE